MIEENVKNLLESLPETNPFGEKVTLVGAVKLQPPEAINRAICGGLRDIGDNHVQEFKDKYDFIEGSPVRHFIGHLQTNKVKYLIDKVDLYHSLDRYALAEELSKRSEKANVVSNVLIQINIGNEESKSGFDLSEANEAYAKIKAMPALKIKGLMAMLPDTDDTDKLERLARLMRKKFDELKASDPDVQYLSMGMSGDYKLCIQCGSNMVRLGTAIFGHRQRVAAPKSFNCSAEQ
ncbi:MAG: YggS family pyridoxal phosphate-dependent enzyme [Clostridia bacterium]|nr:YggS family pyridoxal phosphate-dependent enzyme [Clostridia bacterium]